MKAAVFEAFGPPDVLHVADVPMPGAPRRHELLIRVHAASVNFGDLLVRNFAAVTPGAFHMPWLFWLIGRATFGFLTPRVHVLGSEFAGTVAAVGPEVTRFAVGDAVFGYRAARMGTYAEYVRLAEDGIVAAKPAAASFEEAASCPYGALMALGVIRKLGVRPGQHVLVIGASGGIGPPLVQLAARHAGAVVTGVCSGARRDYVLGLGANAVVDYTEERVVDRPEIYDLVIDVLGKTPFTEARRILAPHGRMVYLSFKSRQILQMLWTAIAGGPRVLCTLVSERQSDLEAIRALIDAGTLRPVVDRVFPLEEVAAAHRYAEGGTKTGAVVVSVAPA